MRFKPFRHRINRDNDMIYDFLVKSSDEKNEYLVEITIDELNDDLVILTRCECQGYHHRKQCKHIQGKYDKEGKIIESGALQMLSAFNVVWRTDDKT